MSNPRFAPITSALLVRKGDAVPSAVLAHANLSLQRGALAPAPGVALTKPTFAFGAARVPAASPAVVVASVVPEAAPIMETPPAETPAEPIVVASPPTETIVVASPPPVVSGQTAVVDVRKQPAPSATEAPKPHRLMVTLSHEEYERLGIAAVKKGVTRHQLVRHGFELHMKKLMREYATCGCMTGGTGRCSDSCAH